MSKPRSPIADWIVYVVVRFTVCVLQALSPTAAVRFADGLAWLAYHLNRRHRRVADDNLKHAFPELDDRRRDALVRAVYRHFCGLFLDIVQLPRAMSIRRWRRHMELVGGRSVVDGLLSGRPLLLITAHFGNWEMGGYALGLLGFRTHAIARKLDNPHLDDFFRRRFRERTRQQILDKNDDYERIQAVLAEGGALGTLADQDAGAKGLFVEFFGRPASTHKAVALLALEYGATCIVIATPKVSEPLGYRCEAVDAFRAEEYAGRPDAVRAITERFTAALEAAIRRHPEQYFWLHRRWKHQPAPKKRAKATAA
jgi:Kdo2-lipid IVA lauroyltransferase/acyltransferase